MLCTCFTLMLQAQSFDPGSLSSYRTQYKHRLFNIIGDDTAYLRFFAPDAAYYVPARVQLLVNQPVFEIPTTGTLIRKARKYARLTFEIGTSTETLYLYKFEAIPGQEKMADMLFLPFFDATNGQGSYEGGRYLDFKFEDIQGDRLYIDFNRAYTGYCAYTTGYNCPIPPAENKVKVRVEAGESKYGKK